MHKTNARINPSKRKIQHLLKTYRKKRKKRKFLDNTWQGVDRLHERQLLKQKMDKYVEDGQVMIIDSGMDCDGSCWYGHKTLLPASVIRIEKWIHNFYEDAEGRQDWEFVKPSVGKEVEQTSRDASLEAFENGHSHMWVY